MQESLEFYNKFDKKLINDYVFGNKRIVKAIEILSAYIPDQSKNILDIGCGLGWSSYEFARTFSSTKVLGVDLSPVLIETAEKLFGTEENLIFKSIDLTRTFPEGQFDAIVLIDVYEHIPISDRDKFHDAIKNCLNLNGRLILACPSKFHQDFLREHNPAGLQPVDEDVDINDIAKLAKDIDGEVIFFEYQTIWKTNDYFYTIIEIKPQYQEVRGEIKVRHSKVESINERISRVNSRLGLDFELQKEDNSVVKTLKKIKRKLT
ncbi:class I SAM-dependent methyltransferase [Psychroserpens sp. BH13MA-6]